MRLINASTGQLEYFFEDVPKYAILSHTWEDEEVTFQEFSKLSAKTKKGYLKIERSCRIALLHGLQYAWVDTCCIDKTSSAELTESINSMFPWYQRAEKCYAFLSDLRPGALAEEKLAACRWFTRGWTLQELIAPKEVRFYDQEWNFIGTKMDFSDKISSITGIDMNILQGTSEPNERSIATRMSWAAHRQTSRIEDLAYCLLGIFDVNMPLIYGEGWKAFRRLQEEIVRHSNDLTIFAWDHEKEQEQDAQWGLFSPSPSGFAKSAFVQRYNRQTVDPEFSITNKGLRFDRSRYLYKMSVKKGATEVTRYAIPLGYRKDSDGTIDYSIQLRKSGPNVFLRDGKLLVENRDTSYSVQSRATRLPMINNFHIHVDTQHSPLLKFIEGIHVPKHDRVQIKEVIPESHWDETNRMFFTPPEDHYSLALAMFCHVTIGTAGLKSRVKVVVYILFGPTIPSSHCRIFDPSKHQEHSAWLFRHKRLGHNVTWHDIEADLPEILKHTSELEVSAEGEHFTISVSLSQGLVKSISEQEIYSLNFDVKLV